MSVRYCIHSGVRKPPDCFFSFVNMKDDKYLMQVMQHGCERGGVSLREAGFKVTALPSLTQEVW